jgi:hypothetical protein
MAMASERVTFARASCLIEVERQDPSGERSETRHIARMSVVENAGAVVRPLVGRDGRRIKIVATSERLAMKVAISYLEGRFGRVVPPDPIGSLGSATVGVPFVAH